MTGIGSGLGTAGASIIRPIIAGGPTPDPAEDPKTPPKRFPLYTGPLVPARNPVTAARGVLLGRWHGIKSESWTKVHLSSEENPLDMFYPFFQARISEFNSDKTISTDDLHKALNVAETITSNDKLEKIFNSLQAINPKLPDYIKLLLDRQYGRRVTGFGQNNSISADFESYSEFFDFFRYYQKQEIYDVINSAIFYHHLNLDIKNEKDNKNFELTFTDNTGAKTNLITGKLEHGKMHYSMADKIPEGLKDKAIIHMADMIASNRQSNNSNFVKITMGNPLEVMRLVSILVCHHRMNVDIGEIFEEVQKQLGYLNEPELQEKWQQLAQFAGAFHLADSDKLSPSLRAQGYKFEQIKPEADKLFLEISGLLDDKPLTPAPKDEKPEDDEDPTDPPHTGPTATLSPTQPLV